MKEKPWLLMEENIIYGDLDAALHACTEKDIVLTGSELLGLALQLVCGMAYVASKNVLFSKNMTTATSDIMNLFLSLSISISTSQPISTSTFKSSPSSVYLPICTSVSSVCPRTYPFRCI